MVVDDILSLSCHVQDYSNVLSWPQSILHARFLHFHVLHFHHHSLLDDCIVLAMFRNTDAEAMPSNGFISASLAMVAEAPETAAEVLASPHCQR